MAWLRGMAHDGGNAVRHSGRSVRGKDGLESRSSSCDVQGGASVRDDDGLPFPDIENSSSYNTANRFVAPRCSCISSFDSRNEKEVVDTSLLSERYVIPTKQAHQHHQQHVPRELEEEAISLHGRHRHRSRYPVDQEVSPLRVKARDLSLDYDESKHQCLISLGNFTSEAVNVLSQCRV